MDTIYSYKYCETIYSGWTNGKLEKPFDGHSSNDKPFFPVKPISNMQNLKGFTCNWWMNLQVIFLGCIISSSRVIMQLEDLADLARALET